MIVLLHSFLVHDETAGRASAFDYSSCAVTYCGLQSVPVRGRYRCMVLHPCQTGVNGRD